MLRLPPQCTFWRFLASLHLSVARQLWKCSGMRQRVWEAAHVQLKAVTLDTDTTVHTLFGKQMGGAQKLQPEEQGKEELPADPHVSGRDAGVHQGRAAQWRSAHRRSDRPASGQGVGGLPPGVETIYARADSGFYCGRRWRAYEKPNVQFIISARKTSRLVDELKAADWKGSPHTDADGQCEFRYQPEGWGQAYRFMALRYEKTVRRRARPRQPEQYQLFDTPEYSYRVFVTNMKDAICTAGVVLQSAGGSREPDQGSQ